jgi:hypothetical protein
MHEIAPSISYAQEKCDFLLAWEIFQAQEQSQIVQLSFLTLLPDHFLLERIEYRY